LSVTPIECTQTPYILSFFNFSTVDITSVHNALNCDMRMTVVLLLEGPKLIHDDKYWNGIATTLVNLTL